MTDLPDKTPIPGLGTAVIRVALTGAYGLTFDWSEVNLLPQHEAKLRSSALHPTVVVGRGYRSLESRADARKLGFPKVRLPALYIPHYTIDKTVDVAQVRPDHPRQDRRGRDIKYQFPNGSRLRLDVHPMALGALTGTSCDVFIAESVLKADALLSRGLCAIGLSGVWGWKGEGALADWGRIPLAGRRVFIVFDSDIDSNPDVREAAVRLRDIIEGEVIILRVPPAQDGAKQGIDDYLAAGGRLKDLRPLPDRTPILQQAFLKAIRQYRGVNLRVAMALLGEMVRRGTVSVNLSRRQLAEMAGVGDQSPGKALKILVQPDGLFQPWKSQDFEGRPPQWSKVAGYALRLDGSDPIHGGG